MIVTLKEIYKEVSQEMNLPEHLVDSIGSIIFTHTRECLDEPNALGIELKGFGTFNLVQPEFIDYVRKYRSRQNSVLANETYKARLTRYESLIKEIDRFKKQKILKRNERYKSS